MKRAVCLFALAFAGALSLWGCPPSGEPDVVFSLPESEYWENRSSYPGVGDGKLLITNNASDNVSVVELSTAASNPTEVARVPVGFNPVEREGPHHVTADPKGEFYYVGISNYVPGAGSGPHGVHGSGTADGHVLKVRASDNLTVGSARVDRNPGDVRLTPDGTQLLLSHFDLLKVTEQIRDGGTDYDARLAIIDPAAMRRIAMVKVCPAPHGIAVSPDSKTVYVSCFSDELAVMKLEHPTYPVERFAVIPAPGGVTAPICSPYAVTLSPSGDSAWVSCFESGDLAKFDVAAHAMDHSKRVRLPGRAVFGTFTANGATLIVPHQLPDGVSFVDPDAGILFDVPAPPEKCLRPHAVMLTEGEQKLLVVCEGDHRTPGTLAVLDIASRTFDKKVDLGLYPDDFAVLKVPR